MEVKPAVSKLTIPNNSILFGAFATFVLAVRFFHLLIEENFMKVGTLVAALVGGIVMFGLGFLFFGLLFAEYFKANTVEYPGLVKDPPLVWAIFLFNLAWGWLIAWVVDRSGLGGWGEGAKAGAIIMFVLALGIDLEFHAFMNLHKELGPMLAHILIVTGMGAVAGAVIGLVLGYFSKR